MTVSFEIVMTLIGGIISVLLALLGSLLSSKQIQLKAKDTEQIEKIAKAVQAEDSAGKAAALRAVIEKMPAGISQEKFSEFLAQAPLMMQRASSNTPELSAVERLISAYHQQALAQARAQFWFSVVAAAVGFAWILYTGMDIQPTNLESTAKTWPGIVMDAVAFLFFRQASATRERATELYDRLRRDKQLSESVTLVSSIEDVRVKSAVKAQIALHMSGLTPTPIDLSNFLSGQTDKA